MENYGGKLKELRKTRGLSQKDMALKIGISAPNLSQWEGMAFPPLEGILKVCSVLNIPLAQFFNDNSEQKHEQMPDWIKPEYLDFLEQLRTLPEEVQKQLLKNFSGIIGMRKIF